MRVLGKQKPDNQTALKSNSQTTKQTNLQPKKYNSLETGPKTLPENKSIFLSTNIFFLVKHRNETEFLNQALRHPLVRAYHDGEDHGTHNLPGVFREAGVIQTCKVYGECA